MATVTKEWIDFATLKDEAATHWRTVLEHYGMRPRKSGRQLVTLCPWPRYSPAAWSWRS
jgi:hypothetical protein